MRIRYTFDVKGTFRQWRARTFFHSDAEISVKLSSNKVLQQLSITYQVVGEYKLPKIRSSAEPGIDGEIEITEPPYKSDAIGIATRLEAQLSVLGVERIDTERPGFEWIPETQEERASLQLSGWSSFPGVPAEAHPVWRRGVFRAALRCPEVDPIFQLQLGFYRSGWTEVKRFRYVEAYFFFFLFIDGIYGQSQTKGVALKRAFLNSPELLAAVGNALNKRNSDAATGSSWAGFNEERAIERLINVRGHLFHNPENRKKKWHPDRQSDHAADAMFLAEVCAEIAYRRLWSDEEHLLPAFPVVQDDDFIRFADFLARERVD